LPRDANRRIEGRELFLDAAAKVASGRYESAIDSLQRTIEEQPGHAAAHFCLAYCRQILGQFEGSLERYDAARVLMPKDPRPFFQRGIIYGLLRKPSLAEAEFSRAIALKGEYAQAYRNRAVARMRLNKMREAEDDLGIALSQGAPSIQIHLLRADVRQTLGDAKGAKDDRDTVANTTPKSEGDFLIRGLTRMGADPDAAIADFRSAAKINPHSIPAIQNQITVLADKLKVPDLDGALVLATRAIGLYPEYAPFRSNRAVIFARLGRREEAHKEIEKARQISEDAEIVYRTACVYSLTSVTHPEDVKKALEMLRKAIRDKCQDAAFARDKDLDPIRNLAEFREIVQAATTLR
jgi:eukaryotic-like serine/threonine-protein kinase